MAYKFFSVFGLVAITLGSPVQVTEFSGSDGAKVEGFAYGHPTQRVQVAPAYKQLEYEQQFAPAAYDFNYAVHDEHTGDIKSQKEVRSGDSVQGRYELIDSDGFRRIVEYTADGEHGFNAVVHREPVDFKIPQPIPQDPKLVYPAPIAKEVSAPVQAQPIAKNIIYAAPKYSSPPLIRQYYASPTYPTPAHSSYAPSFQANSGSVYSSPVHAAAITSHDEASYAPRQQFFATPVFKSPVYAIQTQNQNAYSAQRAYNTQTAPAPTFNSIASVGPAYNINTYSVPAFKPQASIVKTQNQGYYVTPAYNAAQPVARIVYSAPGTVVYSGRLATPNNYYNQGTPNSQAPAEYASLRFAQAQAGELRTAYSTAAPETSSDAAKFENDISQSNFNNNSDSANEQSKPSYSNGSDASYDAYRVSTTPSYKQ